MDFEIDGDADADLEMDFRSSRLAVIPDDDVVTQLQELAPSQPGRTVLPSPVARAVSIATRSTSLALRVGTLITGYGFDAAKVTTLSSLELGRAMLEGILGRAGKDAIARSGSTMAKRDAETILEKSLENLHRTMSQIVFWTTTGFQMTESTMAMFSDTSLMLLSGLDQCLGSTDSSRAMASIITLIRREFDNPATGVQGEQVGVIDLMLGLCGMAYLQKWSCRLLDEERRNLRIDEVVWDVVVFDDGARADVHDESLYGVHNGQYAKEQASLEQMSNRNIIATIEDHGAKDSDDERERLPEKRLRENIMRSLHDNAAVSITTKTNTIKTITVDITGGAQELRFSPPPGVEVVESKRLIDEGRGLQGQVRQPDVPGSMPTVVSRIVYRLHRNKERRMSFRKEDGDISQVAGYVEQVDDDEAEGGSATEVGDNDGNEDENETRPPVPPKPAVTGAGAGAASKLETPPRRPSSAASAASSSSSASLRPSRLPTPQKPATSPPVASVGLPPIASVENTANQKRPRMPLSPSPSAVNNRLQPPSRMNKFLSSTNAEKRVRNVWEKMTNKDSSPSQSGSEAPAPPKKSKKDSPPSQLGPEASASAPSKQSKQKDPTPSRSGSEAPAPPKKPIKQTQTPKTTLPAPKPLPAIPPSSRDTPITASASSSFLGVPSRRSSLLPKSSTPRTTSHGHGARSASAKKSDEPYSRPPSRTSYISVHSSRRDSMISQTESYSITAAADEYRPVSPCTVEEEGIGMADSPVGKSTLARGASDTAARSHRRPRVSPSIYTLRANESQSSLIPLSYYHKSAFSDLEALSTLRRAGVVDGIFPKHHLLRNITRFMRFASASYGSRFLKIMGIAKAMPILRAVDDTHHELRSFAHHTESEPNSILLSSFVDPQGGTDGTGSTNTGVPLVHYISLDHESKAVVLACRGTLGFEDVMADMTCSYDDLVWQGKTYKVHKGIHASAQRLLYGGDGRVLYTLKQALEQHPDYGLVLTGHSLGGAVTALLGVMLSEPTSGTSFIISAEPHTKLLGDGTPSTAGPPRHVCLPSGRPIHVYAYGPPSTMSASLSTATRGLITSIVNGNDMVPYLSLGVLHDFQAMALAFKTDNLEAKSEVRQRIWEAFQSGIADKWYGSHGVDPIWLSGKMKQPASSSTPDRDVDDSQWAYAALKILRASMMNTKLLPPGEVFTIENTQVLRRDAFVTDEDSPRGGNGGQYGRPAQRVVLRYIKDVEKRFREVRFGTSMLTDHSPGKYEDALERLKKGVMEEE